MCCRTLSARVWHVSHLNLNVLAKLIRFCSTNFIPFVLQVSHLARLELTVSCILTQLTIRCGAVSPTFVLLLFGAFGGGIDMMIATTMLYLIFDPLYGLRLLSTNWLFPDVGRTLCCFCIALIV